MMKIWSLLFFLATISVANPTHYFDGKWYTCNCEEKINNKGNIIYQKITEEGKIINEERYKYDSKGYLIYQKSTGLFGRESWYKNDNKGKNIYTKTRYFNDNYVQETWIDRDSLGRPTHVKYSTGGEDWYEYNGNKVSVKNSNNNDSYYEIDEKGYITYLKDIHGEEWNTLDSLGRVIYTKNSTGEERHFKYFEKKIKDGYILYKCHQE